MAAGAAGDIALFPLADTAPLNASILPDAVRESRVELSLLAISTLVCSMSASTSTGLSSPAMPLS